MENSQQHIHNKFICLLVAVALAVSLCPIATHTQAVAEENETQSAVTEPLALEEGTYNESQVIVKFKNSVESDATSEVLESTDAVKDESDGSVDKIDEHLATVKVEEGKTVAEAIEELSQDSRVEYAEPDLHFTLFDDAESDVAGSADSEQDLSASLQATTTVNDPYASNQWYLDDTYSNVKGAWDNVKCEGKNVTVAILDSGIDTDHPDLKNNIIASTSVISNSAEDKIGHGTEVAGVISGVSNNKVGISGVSYNAKILPIKVADSQTSEDGFSDILKGLEWVISNKTKYNIRVVNLSLGSIHAFKDSEISGSTVLKSVKEKITQAYNAGILCVCSSGNWSQGEHTESEKNGGVVFPASLSDTISVGAVNNVHSRPSFSIGGSNLDVVAPGVDMCTTYPGGVYASGLNGTSFSAPFVSAAVALCFAANPNATAGTIKSCITSTAHDLGKSGTDVEFGEGQVDVKAAVVKAKSQITSKAMYRLYNPNSGEHFYTASAGERDNLKKVGWRYEGIAWNAPSISGTPVYRLYNPNGGDHHYTTSSSERQYLIKVGWRDESIGWYSDEGKSVPVYRQYNPNAKTGSHNFTTSLDENNYLVKQGWKGEGIAWYGL